MPGSSTGGCCSSRRGAAHGAHRAQRRPHRPPRGRGRRGGARRPRGARARPRPDRPARRRCTAPSPPPAGSTLPGRCTPDTGTGSSSRPRGWGRNPPSPRCRGPPGPRAGRVFARARLLSEVGGHDCYGGTRTVDAHVRRLRADHEHLITTVHDVGCSSTATPPRMSRAPPPLARRKAATGPTRAGPREDGTSGPAVPADLCTARFSMLRRARCSAARGRTDGTHLHGPLWRGGHTGPSLRPVGTGVADGR
jgi:hypothetical protein